MLCPSEPFFFYKINTFEVPTLPKYLLNRYADEIDLIDLREIKTHAHFFTIVTALSFSFSFFGIDLFL